MNRSAAVNAPIADGHQQELRGKGLQRRSLAFASDARAALAAWHRVRP